MHRLFLLLFFIIFPFESLLGSSLKIVAETTILNVSFANIERGYTLEYPNNWIKNDVIQGFDLFIMAPKEADGKLHANVSIISGDLPKDMDLETYYQENIKNLQKKNVIKIKENGQTEIAGLVAKWIQYTREDDQTEIIHYFFIANHAVFLITCGATEKAFKRYSNGFETIVNSFKLIKSDENLRQQRQQVDRSR